MELFIILLIAACAFVWGLVNFFIGRDINEKLHKTIQIAKRQQENLDKEIERNRALEKRWRDVADDRDHIAKYCKETGAVNYQLAQQVSKLDLDLREARAVIASASVDLKSVRLKSKTLDKVITDLDGYSLAVEKVKSESEEAI